MLRKASLTVLLIIVCSSQAFQLVTWTTQQRTCRRLNSKRDEMDEAFRNQQEILSRRRNKNKMKEYMDRVENNRRLANEKVNMWKWQRRNDGKDPLEDWLKMKEEGKIPKLYDEGDNPEGGIPIPGASFGVGGQFGVGGKWDEGARFDLRLPYAEQGYVDEDSDFMGKLFGKKKKPSSFSEPKKPGKSQAPTKKTPNSEPKRGWFW